MISNLIHRFANPCPRHRRRSALAAARRTRLGNSLRAEPLEDRRLLAGIFGYKFEDLNGNSVQDAGEPGIEGVEISVLVDDGVTTPFILTDITDANGEYQFEDLPAATMTVTETPPPGSIQTTADPAPFFLNTLENAVAFAGQSNQPIETVIPELAFGNAIGIEIIGNKYEDINGDGIRNVDEPGIDGVTIELLDGQGNVVAIQTTANGGVYQFAGLLPGDYEIREIVPAGFVQTSPDTGTYVLNNLTSATTVVGADFGNTVLGSIHGFKFEDIDGNGIYDPNSEPPLANVTFTLTGTTGLGTQLTRTTVTDAEGRFWYTNLLPGTYTVAETVPAGFVPTTPISGTFNLESRLEFVWAQGEANLPPNDPRIEVFVGDQLIFGNTVPGSIHGFKFEDIDGNGVYDPANEPPLANVTITLEGITGLGTTLTRTTTTDASGQFWFTGLLPGNYAVTETPPPGFVPTTVPFRFLTINSREELVWTPGAAELPAGDPRFEVLANGIDGPSLLFGNTVPGSIHGFKFEDIDGNGIYDPNSEPPLPNVTFTLTGVTGLGTQLTRTTVTDAEGRFWYTDLLPGTYTVTETPPPGFFPTTPISRTFNLESREEFVWAAGEANLQTGDPRVEVLVGDELIFGNTVPGSIHGFKFEDLDGDGMYDPNSESPLANVTFTLTGTTGLGTQVTLSTTTGTDGRYWFTNLLPGDYTVTETVPNGFVPTTSVSRSFNLGSRQEFVWAVGEAQLPTGDPRIEVFVDEALIFGNTVPGSIHGFKFLDDNGNGFYEPNLGEQAQAGVEFQLTGTDGLGNPVNQTETTDGNGQFWFVGLLPSVDGQGLGTGYTITEVVPTGFVATTPTQRTFDLQSRQELVWQDGAAMLDSDDPRTEVLVGIDLMFGNVETGSFHGFKFEDFDADGVYDPIAGDTAQANVDFRLTGIDNAGNPVDRTETTDANGQFWFEDLFPSVFGQGQGSGYTITEVVPDGYVPTTPTERFFNLPAGIEYVWEQGAAMLGPLDPQVEEIVGEQLIWGNTIPGSFHGFKFEDVNADGNFDPAIGDLPQPGVPFQIIGIDGQGNQINLITNTDDTGQFWFEDLLPSVNGQGFGTGYSIVEIVPYLNEPTTGDTARQFNLPSGREFAYQVGAAMLDPNDPQTEVVVGSELIFGNTVDPSIHGFKFEDFNGNGIYEPGLGEVPQPGVEFTLTGTDGQGTIVNETVLTDENGEFWFVGLFPSVAGQGPATGYTVTETVPVGFVTTTPPIARTFDLEARRKSSGESVRRCYPLLPRQLSIRRKQPATRLAT